MIENEGFIQHNTPANSASDVFSGCAFQQNRINSIGQRLSYPCRFFNRVSVAWFKSLFMFNKLSFHHFAILLFCVGLPLTSLAVQPRFIGYTGKSWAADYGVLTGECNTKEAQKTSGSTAVLELDEASLAAMPLALSTLNLSATDAFCFGHTLELVPAGQFVRWISPSTGAGIYVSPHAKSETCRTYIGVVAQNGQKTKFRGEACTSTPGIWKTQPQPQ